MTEILEVIRRRRVVRFFTDAPVPEEVLWKILEAARWAPTGGNRRVHRFVCIMGADLIRQVKMVSPGILGVPTALVIVCIDWRLAGCPVLKPKYRSAYIDVGTATQNMLLAAHTLGVGACPVTSFSPEAIQELLNFPKELTPELIVCLGHPSPYVEKKPVRPQRPTRVKDLVHWGAFRH